MNSIKQGNPDSWKKDRIAELEREKFLEAYLQLSKNLDPEPGQNFMVIVFLLLDSPRDDIHGSMFPVGMYSSRQQAERKCTELINEHDIDRCRIYQVAKWGNIMGQAPTEAVKYLTPDGKIKSLQDMDHVKKVEAFRKEVALRDKIEEEHLRSAQPGTIEHYTYSWYRAIKHKAKIDHLTRELEIVQKAYQESVSCIQQDYKADPNLDLNWLLDLKPKLEERNEMDVYSGIVSGYKQLKPEILGSND